MMKKFARDYQMKQKMKKKRFLAREIELMFKDLN